MLEPRNKAQETVSSGNSSESFPPAQPKFVTKNSPPPSPIIPSKDEKSLQTIQASIEILQAESLLTNENFWTLISTLYSNRHNNLILYKKIHAAVYKPSLKPFWYKQLKNKELLRPPPGVEVYHRRILYPHYDDIDTCRGNTIKPKNRHPFDILAGYVSRLHALQAKIVMNQISWAIIYLNKKHIDDAIMAIQHLEKAADMSKDKRLINFVTTCKQLSGELNNFVAERDKQETNYAFYVALGQRIRAKIAIAAALEPIKQEYLAKHIALATQGEHFEDYGCSELLFAQDKKKLEQAANDYRLVSSYLISSMLERAQKTRKIHYSLGYQLTAQTQLALACYYQSFYYTLHDPEARSLISAPTPAITRQLSQIFWQLPNQIQTISPEAYLCKQKTLRLFSSAYENFIVAYNLISDFLNATRNGLAHTTHRYPLLYHANSLTLPINKAPDDQNQTEQICLAMFDKCTIIPKSEQQDLIDTGKKQAKATVDIILPFMVTEKKYELKC